jgi:hypothetical protein
MALRCSVSVVVEFLHMCPECEDLEQELAYLGSELWKAWERAARAFDRELRQEHLAQADKVHRILLDVRVKLLTHQTLHQGNGGGYEK